MPVAWANLTARRAKRAEQSRLLCSLTGLLGTSPAPKGEERRGRSWRPVHCQAREAGQGPHPCPSQPWSLLPPVGRKCYSLGDRTPDIFFLGPALALGDPENMAAWSSPFWFHDHGSCNASFPHILSSGWVGDCAFSITWPGLVTYKVLPQYACAQRVFIQHWMGGTSVLISFCTDASSNV